MSVRAEAGYAEQGVGALVRTSSNHSSGMEHKYTTSRLAVGQLDGAEALRGKVGILTARGDAVEVEWECDSRTVNRNCLGKL